METPRGKIDFWEVAERIPFMDGTFPERPTERKPSLFPDMEEAKTAVAELIDSLNFDNWSTDSSVKIGDITIESQGKSHGGLALSFRDANHHIFASFNLISLGDWKIDHRFVSEEYRGRGVAKLALFAMERFVTSEDNSSPGDKLIVGTSQLSVLIWLLNSGFEPKKDRDRELIDELLEYGTYRGAPVMVGDVFFNKNNDFWLGVLDKKEGAKKSNQVRYNLKKTIEIRPSINANIDPVIEKTNQQVSAAL